MKAAVVTAFRDRGRDPNRPANLKRVCEHWAESPWEHIVVDDGLTGSASFNRSSAYNRALDMTHADILVYSEADLLPPFDQIERGIEKAAAAPGLVVPFSRFMEITEADSIKVRNHELEPHDAESHQVRGDYKSIGAVNIVSRESIAAIGRWPTEYAGAWFDDDACEHAFRVCCGPTRFEDGPAFHLYHLSGGHGAHLTAEDKAATARNKRRYRQYLAATTPEQIRALTLGLA